jgi:predicted short-subunit dehydrogenase-like oxidoreductase (DUF2520 family)
VDVAVVGAGRLGTAVAVQLARAGHTIVAVSGREATGERAKRYLPGVRVTEPSEAANVAELTIVAVPDDLLTKTVEEIAVDGAFRARSWVAHLSGAWGLDALEAARAAGAGRFALHPLQTFPDVEGAIAGLSGCVAALTADDDEGFAIGEGLAADLTLRPFRLRDELRPLYHAAAVFASNDLVAVSAVAERLFAQADVPDPLVAMLPLQRTTLDNVARLGPGGALTGPVVRGDAGTVARNLEALSDHAPDAVEVYVVLARVALDVAMSSGRLTPDRRAAVDEVLARWS